MIKIEKKRDYYAEIMSRVNNVENFKDTIESVVSISKILKYCYPSLELPSHSFSKRFILTLYYNTVTKKFTKEPISNVTIKLTELNFSFENKSQMSTIGKNILENAKGLRTDKDLEKSVYRIMKGSITKEIQKRLKGEVKDSLNLVLEGKVVIDMLQDVGDAYFSASIRGEKPIYQEEKIVNYVLNIYKSKEQYKQYSLFNNINNFIKESHSLDKNKEVISLYPEMKEFWLDLINKPSITLAQFRQMISYFENEGPLYNPEILNNIFDEIKGNVIEEKENGEYLIQETYLEFPNSLNNKDFVGLKVLPSLNKDEVYSEKEYFTKTDNILESLGLVNRQSYYSSGSQILSNRFDINLYKDVSVYVFDYEKLIQTIDEFLTLRGTLNDWSIQEYSHRKQDFLIALNQKGVFKPIEGWFDDTELSKEEVDNILSQKKKQNNYNKYFLIKKVR